MNGVNYQTLIMMLSDAPRYKKAKNKDRGPKKTKRTAKEEADDILGFFQSRM